MEEITYGFWLSLLMLPFGGGDAAPPAPAVNEIQGAPFVHYAIEYADTNDVIYAVEEGYASAGISRNETLTWQFQPYDGIVNWYNQYSQVIKLSELPRDEEIAPYWDNWSETLTGGAWDWRAFFEDEAEARTMARFNQFVLAAHEYGHALTYRYDPDHEAREDNAVNCRELPADRLAAALLEELADVDPLIARYRLRYGDLVTSINAAIPDAYDIADYASLDADCHIIHVAQPDETTMAPYASAYFARWRVLLQTDLPPLADLCETYLFTPWRDRMVKASPSAEWVATVEWIDDDLTGNFEHGDAVGWRLPAFGPDGKLFVMSFAVTPREGDAGLYLTYGPAGGKKKTVIDTDGLQADIADPEFFELTAFLPLGNDRFLTASSDMWGEDENLVLLDFRRGPDGWSHRMAQPLPGIRPAETRLRTRHDGAVLLEVYQFGTEETPARWLSYALDLETMTLGEVSQLPDTPYAWFSDIPDGATVLIDTHNPSILVTKGFETLRIAGNGLQGFKELEDPLDVEFNMPSAAIGLDGKIRVLDYEPYRQEYVVREIELKK